MKQDCAEAVQAAMSRLFDRGYDPADIATAQLKLYSNIAVLGMSREEAAAMLRETAASLERNSTP